MGAPIHHRFPNSEYGHPFFSPEIGGIGRDDCNTINLNTITVVSTLLNSGFLLLYLGLKRLTKMLDEYDWCELNRSETLFLAREYSFNVHIM